MNIGIVGGTGGMGEGFALRWCVKHDVIVGSREAKKAQEAAANYANAAKQAYGSSIAGSITGDDNISLAKNSDVLILSIPYEFIDDMCSKLAARAKSDCIVVSPIVPMTRTDPAASQHERANNLAATRDVLGVGTRWIFVL